MARRWLDETTSAGTWTTDDPQAGAKILVIAHRMAARRLGFENMYAAFHDSGSSSLSQALDEGTAWPAKFFTDKVLPLARASGGARIALLQKHCPRFQEARLQEVGVIDVLKDLRRHVDELTAATQSGGPGSVKTVLDIVVAARLVELDPRFEAFRRGSQAETGVVISDSTAATLEAFMHCDVHEIEGYQRYIGEESPYSTHQGVKGAEFPRVVVVLDDEEGCHNQFSYDKLFGIKEPSQIDHSNKLSGKETVFERTRRLLYVCASRSTEALAIVLYAHDVDGAVAALRASGMPGADCPITLQSLGCES